MPTAVNQDIVGYTLVHIDNGGFIYRVEGRMRGRMVHKESRWLTPTCVSLTDAKHLLETIPNEGGIDGYGAAIGILGVTHTHGGGALFVPSHVLNVWKERLKVWSGCYGTWPCRSLRGVS